MILTGIVEKSLPHAWRFRCPDVGLLKIVMPSLYISTSGGHKRGLLGVTRDAVAFLPFLFPRQLGIIRNVSNHLRIRKKSELNPELYRIDS